MELGKQMVASIDASYLDLFRELIHERLGIYISWDKNYLLENKIGRLLARGDYKSVGDLYKMLKNNSSGAMEDLVRYITTTHTFFFRENTHLTILRNDILLRKVIAPKIWVAAAATGEEVYSIIIELLEHGIIDFKIMATDINREVLLHLKHGVYSRDKMREMGDALINKYFTRVGDTHDLYRVKDHLKKHFIIKKLNLIDDLKFQEPFDYIFCRNVLIYFDLATQQRVLGVLLQNLKDLGYLFVGHSESLLHVTTKIEAVFSSVYSKKN